MIYFGSRWNLQPPHYRRPYAAEWLGAGADADDAKTVFRPGSRKGFSLVNMTIHALRFFRHSCCDRCYILSRGEFSYLIFIKATRGDNFHKILKRFLIHLSMIVGIVYVKIVTGSSLIF